MIIKRVGLIKDETRNHQNFLLSVPAGEDSLAHRRHVCSCVIPQAQYSLTNCLDLEKVFARKAPLHVDLGCGDGSFLCALAHRLPNKNFLGVERMSGRVRAAARKASNLDNVRLLQIESSYAVRYLFPARSVETFYLLFPDPWPKRRHHRRRLLTPDFLASVHTALVHDGILYVATDHLDYFRKIQEITRSAFGFASVEPAIDLPQSKFGLIFGKKGATIHRLVLRKVSPVT